jgi:SAM-dependent methyltransferase
MNTKDYRSRIYEHYATNFQDAPATFDHEASARWGRAYRHYFRKWLPPSRDVRIVDLACGGGKLLHFFKANGYGNLMGVDISPEQVALSRQVPAEAELANVLDFLEANPNNFDLITALDLIEHFHKPEVLRFLDGCVSALRSGGRLILQTSNADSPWGGTMRYGDFTHEAGFNPNSIIRLLRLTGFSEIEVREQGPVPLGYSTASSVRSLLWAAIRIWLKVWNIAETGDAGSGVFTRIFLVSGRKA